MSPKPEKERQEKADDFRRRLEEDPGNGELWLDYGLFLQDHYPDNAFTVKAFEKARELLPGKDVRLQLGQAYIDAGQFHKGVSLMKDTAEADPRPEAYCFLANAYLHNEMMQEAEAACRAGLEVDPEYEETFFLLGEVLHDKSRGEAIECYRRAVELDPEYQLAWQGLGRELIHSHEALNEGLECLEKAVALDPDDGWARAYYANALWQVGRVAEAAAQYKTAVDLLPDSPELYQCYRDFLDAVGRAEQAE